MRTNPWRYLVGIVTLSLVLAACGRTPIHGSGDDHDAFVRPPVPDTLTPPPDGLTLPDSIYPPPPPPPDGGPPPPPPTDIGPWPWDTKPPPPPKDIGPLPWDTKPPPTDITPPPPKDIGPCKATCTQMCQVLIACGLIKKSYNQCVYECNGWPSTQKSCLNKMICGGVSSCITIGTCLAPATLPDLTIKSFTAAVKGSTVSYKVQVCNTGKAKANAFYLDLYYNRQVAPGAKNYGNKYVQIKGGLAAGACTVHTFTRHNTPKGTYASWAQVDTDGYVKESNEKNNVKGPVKVSVGGTPPPVKKADLTIKSLDVSVWGTYVATVRYRFNICNNGAVASTATSVHVYYNRKSAPTKGQKGNKSTTVPAIKAGNCVIRDITRTWVQKGTYISWGYVDPDNKVAESNENNNVTGPKTVSVNTTTPGADLKITGFSYQNYAYNTVMYVIKVCNVGKGNAANSQLTLYYNLKSAPKQGQNGNRTITVPGLQAGQCSTRYAPRPNTPSGTYYSYAYIDPKNSIKETNENNNVAGPIKVVVSSNNKPDLHVKSFKAAVSGKNVKYTLQVCNKGKAAATPFRTDIYYNRSSAPKAGQGGNTFVITATLGAGSCRTINRTRSSVAAGTYKSWAFVDTGRWVAESNENNNVGGPVTVTLQPPLSQCMQTCTFAIQCGLFKISQALQCAQWCAGLTTSAKKCVDAAVKKKSCADLKKCKLPPPPPPPPPPGVCADICSYLVNTCKLLPSNQYWTCFGACQSLPKSKITCAQNAKAKKQCMQTVMCIL